MPKKRKPEPFLKAIQIAQLEAGESRPLVVASKNIEKVVDGYTAKTAANDRSRKRGPPYYMVGGTPYYLVSEVIEYFTRNRVETIND
ncbi:MAG: hypothetical protein HN722_01495 [Nitrospina sp.]|jgi:hypothetical protein|nr:hypothetical protein [Nitrospina sp.]